MTREPGWEQRLLTVFDDLEQQAAAAFGAEREAEVAERARSAYAGVTLATRLMAARGTRVGLAVEGVGAVSGLSSSGSPPTGACSAPAVRTGSSGSRLSAPSVACRRTRSPRPPGR